MDKIKLWCRGAERTKRRLAQAEIRAEKKTKGRENVTGFVTDCHRKIPLPLVIFSVASYLCENDTSAESSDLQKKKVKKKL